MWAPEWKGGGGGLQAGAKAPTRVTPAVPPAGAKASGRQGSWQTPTFSSSRIQDYGHPSAPRSRAAVCHDEGPPYAGHGRGERANKILPRRPETHRRSPHSGRDAPRRQSDVWSLCPPGKSSHVPADMLNGNRRWSLSPHERAGHAPTRRSGYAGTNGNKICLHGRGGRANKFLPRRLAWTGRPTARTAVTQAPQCLPGRGR